MVKNEEGIKEVFSYYDAQDIGTINMDDLPEILADCGFILKESQYDEIMLNFDVDDSGRMNFESCIKLIESVEAYMESMKNAQNN